MSKKIVLYNPEIPGNTGSIGRTCLALNMELILIKPLGFDLSEKAVRRAGLDYWKYVSLKEYEDFNEFLKAENPEDKILFFTKTAQNNFYEVDTANIEYFVLGSETKGLPSSIFETYQDHLVKLPMFSDKVRSLNLSNAATAVAYEALRQQLVEITHDPTP